MLLQVMESMTYTRHNSWSATVSFQALARRWLRPRGHGQWNALKILCAFLCGHYDLFQNMVLFEFILLVACMLLAALLLVPVVTIVIRAEDGRGVGVGRCCSACSSKQTQPSQNEPREFRSFSDAFEHSELPAFLIS